MIDLHVHTSCSDGSFAPAAVVALAAETGLSAIAITDHDTVDGIDEALAAGREHGVQVIAGVELSLDHGPRMLDVLGYFFDGLTAGPMHDKLAELRTYRHERNAVILERLAELGMPVTTDELAGIADGEAVGRPHIAEALRRRGDVETINEAFERFLRRGAPAYVDRRRLSLGEGIRLITAAGGVVAIAHPGLIRTDEVGLAALVRDASRLGVVAIECLYPAHSAETEARCLALAARHGLLPTAGSDFHGTVKPEIKLGRSGLTPSGADRTIPDSLLAELRERSRRH